MIHRMVVKPEMTVKEAEKLARKLAMTGGFEVELPENLSQEELDVLSSRWGEQVVKYREGSAARSASLSGRVLKLISVCSSRL